MSNSCNAATYGYARKVGATGERINANARNAVGYGYARKTGATFERILTNALSTRYDNGFQAFGNIVITMRRHSKDISKMRIDCSVLRRSYKRYSNAR